MFVLKKHQNVWTVVEGCLGAHVVKCSHKIAASSMALVNVVKFIIGEKRMYNLRMIQALTGEVIIVRWLNNDFYNAIWHSNYEDEQGNLYYGETHSSLIFNA